MDNYAIEILYTSLRENTKYDLNFYFCCLFSFDEFKRFFTILNQNKLTLQVGGIMIYRTDRSLPCLFGPL